MSWPPTERDMLEIARDSNLTNGASVPDLQWAEDTPPENPSGDRVVLAGSIMTETTVKVGNPDPFVPLSDKPFASYSSEHTKPLVEKGLLTAHKGESCTLYTLTEAGRERLLDFALLDHEAQRHPG